MGVWVRVRACIHAYLVRFAMCVIARSFTHAVVFPSRTEFALVIRKVDVPVTASAAVKTEAGSACDIFHFLVSCAKAFWRVNAKIFRHRFDNIPACHVAAP